MTPTRYLFARAAQPFGLVRRNQRMSDAATETRLLREAETHLGALVWERVEEIEDLSVEYWNLRRLAKLRAEVLEKLGHFEARLNQAQQQRAGSLVPAEDVQKGLLGERDAVLAKLKELAGRRDEVIATARSIRRTYEGLKMKQEVLAKESAATPGPNDELPKVRARLHELKAQFAELKDERQRIGSEIEENDARIGVLDTQLNRRKKAHRAEASEAFHAIGETNKELSGLRAEIGLLDSQMRLLQTDVGRRVSRQTQMDPGCAKVARPFKGLVSIMRALRRSIALNHRLAGRE